MSYPLTDRKLFYAFLVLMVWLPLPLGSNRPWAWSIMEVWVFMLGAFWLYGFIRTQKPELRNSGSEGSCAFAITPLFIQAKPVLILFAIWLAYLLLQLTPLPSGLVALLSPEAGRMHGLLSGVAGGSDWVTLSVDPHASAVFLLKSVTYVLIFCLALLMVSSRKRVRMLAYTIVLSGVFQAVYGSFMTLSGYEHIWFLAKESGVGQATGTFINRNHLAGYLEMCLATGIGLLIAQLGGRSGGTWKARVRELIRLLFSPKSRLRIYLVIMVIALVLTRSRMGNTAFFAGLLITGVIGLLLSRHAPRSTVVLLASLIIIDLFIVGAWFGVEKVVERLEQTSTATGARGEANSYALELQKDYPLIGTGAGSFYAAFPRYQGHDLKGYWDNAHNDYVQFGNETGLVGFVLMGLISVASLLKALQAQYRRRDPLMRGISFAAIMGMVAILIHSTVDFNLQIPANGGTFMVLLALAWISAFKEQKERVRE